MPLCWSMLADGGSRHKRGAGPQMRGFGRRKKKPVVIEITTGLVFFWSGRCDSNTRPLAPHSKFQSIKYLNINALRALATFPRSGGKPKTASTYLWMATLWLRKRFSFSVRRLPLHFK